MRTSQPQVWAGRTRGLAGPRRGGGREDDPGEHRHGQDGEERADDGEGHEGHMAEEDAADADHEDDEGRRGDAVVPEGEAAVGGGSCPVVEPEEEHRGPTHEVDVGVQRLQRVVLGDAHGDAEPHPGEGSEDTGAEKQRTGLHENPQ